MIWQYLLDYNFLQLCLFDNYSAMHSESSSGVASPSLPDNLVPLCKFKIIIIIHFFRN